MTATSLIMELTHNEITTGAETWSMNEFEDVFRANYRDLCSYAVYYLKDKDEAEEAVQDVFVSLWEKREQLQITTSIRSYLFRSVYNYSMNKLKHEKVKRAYEAHHEHTAERAHNPVTGRIFGKELEKRIAQAIETLPEKCREIFMLNRFQHLKYAEIAEHLDLSVKTVENQMGKALKVLREELKEYLPLIALLFTSWLF